ncbi:MAG: type II toxin-antitoxin system VapC family toxin [Fibrobacteres bacterium]|nr:type II toxin-antitoxin system VapC family toxin [Fibrobacterota bacterium]
MGIIIDTSVLIQFERKGSNISEFVKQHEKEEMFLSVITASELLHGVHRATDAGIKANRLAFVEGIIAAIPIIEIDLAVSRLHSQLWSDLSKTGQIIGAHDLWIAATCLAHGYMLVTSNVREFKRIPGLQLIER